MPGSTSSSSSSTTTTTTTTTTTNEEVGPRPPCPICGEPAPLR
jgi:hypothetical protein